MPKRRILIPLPDQDFDVTEVAVPWKIFSRAGHEIVFATEHGKNKPQCDPLLIDGVLFGKLGAEPEAIAFYREMEDAKSFNAPVAWESIEPSDFDVLMLPGGHAPGMRQYLGSKILADRVAAFAALNRPLGAICHGVLVLARAKDPETKKSPLFGRKTTCLPKYMERAAYFLTAWKLGKYYRTYPAYVEDEVRAALESDDDFVRGPRELTNRGTDADDTPAFVVEDGVYVSARWPGDAYLFAKKMLARFN